MIGGVEFQRQHEPVVHTCSVNSFNAQGMVSYKQGLRTVLHIMLSEMIFTSKTRTISLGAPAFRPGIQGVSHFFSE